MVLNSGAKTLDRCALSENKQTGIKHKNHLSIRVRSGHSLKKKKTVSKNALLFTLSSMHCACIWHWFALAELFAVDFSELKIEIGPWERGWEVRWEALETRLGTEKGKWTKWRPFCNNNVFLFLTIKQRQDGTNESDQVSFREIVFNKLSCGERKWFQSGACQVSGRLFFCLFTEWRRVFENCLCQLLKK